jgi:hypothetical protein
VKRWAVVENGRVTNIYAGAYPGAIEVGPEVQVGWMYDGVTWSPPGLPLDVALAEVSAISAARLESGAVHRGVRYPLDTDSRVDWLGLLVMASSLPLPVRVVGVDGSLDLATVGEIHDAARDLALYRLRVQQRSAAARLALVAATDDLERARIVSDYAEDAP